MLYLVVLPELVLRSELLRPEDLDVLVLVGSLMDRNEVVVLLGLILVVEGRCTLEAEEGLETCWLLVLPPLDLLLLLDFLAAKVGSKDRIRAKTSVAITILTVSLYFSAAIIHLLSTYNAITAIFETSSTYNRH